MKRKDTISSLLILGLSAYFWIKTGKFTKYSALFPRVIILIFGFLAFLLLLISIFSSKKEKQAGIYEGDRTSVIISIILIIAWAFFINVLGFLTSTVIFFSVLNILLTKKGTPFRIILSKLLIVIVTILFFYLFFSKLLLVPFPRGILI